MRCRIDFKYALAMELDDPGFHQSVLTDFRDRLAEGERADRLLYLALARLKQAGLVRERTTQHTDSTHVLTTVRDLTGMELVTEAMPSQLSTAPVARSACLLWVLEEPLRRQARRELISYEHPRRRRASQRHAQGATPAAQALLTEPHHTPRACAGVTGSTWTLHVRVRP